MKTILISSAALLLAAAPAHAQLLGGGLGGAVGGAVGGAGSIGGTLGGIGNPADTLRGATRGTMRARLSNDSSSQKVL